MATPQNLGNDGAMSGGAGAESAASRDVVSFCRICNAMCGVVVTVEGDSVVRVRGDDEHPLSRGYACPKGRALGAFHHHPHRLNVPVRRTGASDHELDWATATSEIAAQLQALMATYGPDSVGMYLASGSAFDTNGRRAAERFLKVIGSQQKYTATTVDTPCKPLVAELIGGWSGLTPIWDSEHSNVLLLIGSNPVVSHGHSNAVPDPVRRLREFRARGGRLYVADVRRTETAALADSYLPIAPSTDHVLLAYLVRELLIDGADESYLGAHTAGIDVDALRAVVAPYDRATTLARTGLAGELVDDLLRDLRAAPRISALTGTGTSMSPYANLTEWMLWALNIVKGSYDEPGGMWFNPGYLVQLDTRDWQASDGVPGRGPASRPELPRRFDEYPCAGLASEIEAGNLRALIVVGGNPVVALPDTSRLTAALAQLELLVVVDVIETDTTPYAHYLLPAAGQLERPDTTWLLDSYQLAVAAQTTPAVLPPAFKRRPVWRIFEDLARALGTSVLPRGVDADTATGEALIDAITAKSRGGKAALAAKPHGDVHSGAVFGWVKQRVLPSGRFRLAPPALIEQWNELERTPTQPSLVLVPQRQLRKMNSQLRDTSAPGGRTDAIEIQLSPTDAARLGVTDRDTLLVSSAIGEVRGVASVDERMVPGAVAIPHGWARPNVSVLTSGAEQIDPLTGMVTQSGVAIEVRKAPV